VSNHYIILRSMSFQSDTDLWGYFFWHITLICVLCQRTQIWGNIYCGGHRSEYDVRGHRSEEICFRKDIDLGVTSEDTDLKHILDREGRKHLLQLTAGFTSARDIHWLVPVWYQLISCIIYPFMLCVFFFLFFSCNLWSYCSMHDSVHKTKNRPLDCQ
jgi:hypothetical protein